MRGFHKWVSRQEDGATRIFGPPVFIYACYIRRCISLVGLLRKGEPSPSSVMYDEGHLAPFSRARTCPDSRWAWRFAVFAWHESRRWKLDVKISSRGDIIMREGWTSREENTRREYNRGSVCRCLNFFFL